MTVTPARPSVAIRVPRPGATPPTGPSLPTVSIIVPAYDEEAVIERCLLAAVRQTVPALEIVVVDNRSTDRTCQIVRRVASEHPGSGIRLIHQDAVQGLVPTRNAGFAEATGEVWGRIDADTLLAPDWVEQVSVRLARPGIGAVSGPVSYYDVSVAAARRLSDDLVRRAVLVLSHQYPFLYGSNMAIRAAAWRRIEPDVCLDPEDLLHEDIDLAVHLHQAGLAVRYDPLMRARVSARRLESSPADFRAYAGRFERTYRRHQVQHWGRRTPPMILHGIYWPIRLGRHLLVRRPRGVPGSGRHPRARRSVARLGR